MEKISCKRCVLDTTTTTIQFDSQGICNYCHAFDRQMEKFITIDPHIRRKNLEEMVRYIKRAGKGNKYDSILGLSGGVDSTYMAYFAKKLGLRPLAVHFDNGWNSELAVKNIENIVTKLGIDLKTYVINWNEFKELQLAYLRASVVDVEVPTDQLIFAALNKLASENGIKFILSGANIVTEYGVPEDWAYRNKSDQVNLLNIYRQFGSKMPLTSLPKFNAYSRYFYSQFLGIQTLSLLNYTEYNKTAVKALISQELDWKDYGGKHYESIFTRFYQGFILPKKFGIDKRKAHLSALICSGQITRESALEELKTNSYSIEQQLEDKTFVLKKFGLSEEEFERIMQMPRKENDSYGIENEKDIPHRLFTICMKLPTMLMDFGRRAATKVKNL